MVMKSQSMARRVAVGMRRSWPRALRARAQVRHVRQFRHALTRVARAEPRGAMTRVKARLMAVMEVSVWPARRAMTGS